MWTVGSGDGKSLRGWRLWEISIQMKSICIYFELKSSTVVLFFEIFDVFDVISISSSLV